MNRSFLARWAALLFVVLLALGCAREPDPLWADPGVVRFAPDRVELSVEIHNLSDTARPIGEFAFVGDDWGSLKFTDDALPRTVAAHDSVVLALAVSPTSFRLPDNAYRSGQATLQFRSEPHTFEIPIEFVGTDARGSSALPWWFVLIGLIVAGAALVLATPGLAPRLRQPNPSQLATRLCVAAAIASLLALFATLPFGAGLCLDRLDARVGAAELGQCRAGLGGHALTLLPTNPGLWWWLILVASSTALVGALRAKTSELALIGLGLVRTIGFAIALASLVIGVAPDGLAAIDLVLAQLRPFEFGGLAVPSWGILAQPIACVAVVALAITVPSREPDPRLVAIARIERLVWAALLTTVFLAGSTVPFLSDRPVPPLTHAGMIAAEATLFAAEIVCVAYGLRRAGELLEQRSVSNAALLRAHARWTIPILLANLVVVALWRAY